MVHNITASLYFVDTFCNFLSLTMTSFTAISIAIKALVKGNQANLFHFEAHCTSPSVLLYAQRQDALIRNEIQIFYHIFFTWACVDILSTYK